MNAQMNTGEAALHKYFPTKTPLVDNRLLILDDDKSVADLLQRKAETKGLIAFTVHNLDRFREEYFRLKPSLLILDVILGDDDVLPVIEFLGKVHDKCPIFFLSGYHQLMMRRVAANARGNGLMIVGAFQKKGAGITQLMDNLDKYTLC